MMTAAHDSVQEIAQCQLVEEKAGFFFLEGQLSNPPQKISGEMHLQKWP